MRGVGGRVFRDDPLPPGLAGVYQKIADGAGDVGFVVIAACRSGMAAASNGYLGLLASSCVGIKPPPDWIRPDGSQHPDTAP